MSVRPRNSPNLQACEAGEVNENKNVEENRNEEMKEEENLTKQNKLRLYGFYAIIAVTVIIVLGVTYYLGTLTNRQSMAYSSSEGFELKMHWKGDKDTLNRYGDSEGDACVILAECFASYAPDRLSYPSNPYKKCHEDLKSNLKYFDNGFYYEGNKLVGFISAETVSDTPSYSKVLIYNVCIRKEERGKRIGKYMVPEFIKNVAEKRVPKTVPKTYVGLEVNFESPTSNSAFALYAKMGFIRWWQLCDRVSGLDFKVLEDQEAKVRATTPEYDFPLAKYMLGGKDFMKSQVTDSKGKAFKRLCMVMVKDKDDFGYIGKNFKEVVTEALKTSK